ncbi:MAG: hypothetical protein ACOYL6_02470 [Bacteriovoracaceae bacterium]
MKLDRFLFTMIIITCFGCAYIAKQSPDYPSPKLQKDLVLAIREEVIRLDGEGLIPRSSRNESFIKTTNQIADEALKNKTKFDFYRTFSRLNATYSNIHTHVSFPDKLNREISIPGPNGVAASDIMLAVEILTPTKTKTVLQYIADKDELNKNWEGAELTAINGVALRKWQEENFLFCKWALRNTCDRMLEENLLSGILSWKGGPLVYSFIKDKNKIDIPVTFKMPEGTTSLRYERRQCDWKSEKHFPGFKLIHKGYFACLFQKIDDPTTIILRISSFQYRRGNRVDPKSPIQTMKQETEALKTVWIPKSGSIKHLIVDLIDNGGGNEPIDYYKILLREPFQEQFVKFKKFPEIEDQNLRHSMMNEDPAQELWFQKYVKSGEWAKIKSGEFSKATPMFCADPNKPCDEVLFHPDAHQFTGKVSILLNDSCVSTCDAVVFTLKKYLKAKLYGVSQAADTAFSRLRIDAIKDNNSTSGFKLKISPQRSELDKDLIVSQDVAVTLSVDEEGKIVSGEPLMLDQFVPMQWDQDYHQDTLAVALNDFDKTAGKPTSY